LQNVFNNPLGIAITNYGPNPFAYFAKW